MGKSELIQTYATCTSRSLCLHVWCSCMCMYGVCANGCMCMCMCMCMCVYGGCGRVQAVAGSDAPSALLAMAPRWPSSRETDTAARV